MVVLEDEEVDLDKLCEHSSLKPDREMIIDTDCIGCTNYDKGDCGIYWR